MVRRWLVNPDQEVETAEGVVPSVSLNALANGLIEAATVLTHMGGHLTVTQQRVPGRVDGEMATVGVLVEWRDRTDAKPAPERREPVHAAPPAGRQELDTEQPDEFLALGDEARAQPLDEEEVDESSVPAALRG